jgi:hypothetical protein
MATRIVFSRGRAPKTELKPGRRLPTTHLDDLETEFAANQAWLDSPDILVVEQVRMEARQAVLQQEIAAKRQLGN